MQKPLEIIGGFMRLLFFLAFLSACNSATIFGQNRSIRIESGFQPSSITLSNLSVYKIVIHGTQENPQGSIPSVSGLNLSSNPQTFRSASFINGVPSVRLELSFQSKPDRQGDFSIPSWNLNIGGKSYPVPPASLRVLAPNQQDLLKQEEQKKQEADLRQAAFIEFVNPREFLFLGETVAAEIRLFLWDRLPVTRVERPPLKTGDAFSITEVDQPTEQRNVIRSNKTYSVFTWTVGLTAAMTGNHSLSFDTNIRVRTKNQRGSPFNSPFFNDPFFGFGRDESIKVQSEKNWVEVRQPPTELRPPHFQGAIGSFATKSSIDSDRVSLGDPIRLTFSLSGNGNFSAIPAPGIEPTSDFKIGPPAFAFSGNERTKHEGEQSFEYVITPLKPGLLEIPKVLFAFFDPVKQQYFSTSTPSHTVRVDPGEKWIDPGNVSQKAATEQSPMPATDLFQTESEPGEWVLDLDSSKSLNPWLYWGSQSVPLATFILLMILGGKRRNEKRENLKQKENQFAKKMKNSLVHKDPELFFRSFKGLVRLKIGKLRKHPNPSSLSSSEILALIKQESNSSSLIENLEALLQKCDDQEFAKGNSNQVSLQEEYKLASLILKKVK